VQAIAAETADYSRKSFEEGSAMLQKLLDAKSPENAIDVQTAYAKTACEAFAAQATRMGELFVNLSRPFESFAPEALAARPTENLVPEAPAGKPIENFVPQAPVPEPTDNFVPEAPVAKPTENFTSQAPIPKAPTARASTAKVPTTKAPIPEAPTTN
jgi:hypothetical protein